MQVWIVTHESGYEARQIAAASTEAKANEAIDEHQRQNPSARWSYKYQAIEIDAWER